MWLSWPGIYDFLFWPIYHVDLNEFGTETEYESEPDLNVPPEDLISQYKQSYAVYP